MPSFVIKQLIILFIFIMCFNLNIEIQGLPSANSLSISNYTRRKSVGIQIKSCRLPKNPEIYEYSKHNQEIKSALVNDHQFLRVFRQPLTKEEKEFTKWQVDRLGTYNPETTKLSENKEDQKYTKPGSYYIDFCYHHLYQYGLVDALLQLFKSNSTMGKTDQNQYQLNEEEQKEKQESFFQKHKPFFPWVSQLSELHKIISVRQNSQTPITKKLRAVVRQKVQKLLSYINEQMTRPQSTDLPFTQFLKQALEILREATKQFQFVNKFLEQICKINLIDDKEEEVSDQQINEYFENLVANFPGRDSFREYKLQNFSEGTAFLPLTDCLNCLDVIVPTYNFKEFQQKVNYIFIKWKQLNQKLLSIVITGLLNSGGGLIFVVDQYANDKILSGFDRKAMKNMLNQYSQIRNINKTTNISVQPDKQFTIYENIVKLWGIQKQQLVLKLAVFPKSDNFRMFYYRNANKAYFYEYDPEIPKIILVPTEKVFPSLKRRKKNILHQNMPCEKGFLISEFIEEYESHAEVSTKPNEYINEDKLQRGLETLRDKVQEVGDSCRICVFVPENQQATNFLTNQLKQYGNILRDAKEFVGEIFINEKVTKQLYFLFYEIPDAAFQSLSSRKELQNSQFLQISNRIKLNESLTEFCKLQFKSWINFMIETKIVGSRALIMYEKMQYQKTLKQTIYLKSVIHCNVQEGSYHNKVLPLFSYAFMYYRQFKPILKGQLKKTTPKK